MVAAIFASLAIAQKIQDKDVPVEVKTTFEKLYPNTKKIKWEKEQDHYEASFDLNKVDHSVLFDAKGNVLETEIEIEMKDLPKGVLEYIKANYAGKKVKEAAKITDDKGVVTYEAEIKGIDLLFDESGKFIKETKE